MADAEPADSAALVEPVGEEPILLEHLQRFERARTGSLAVHFHFSRLRDPYHQPRYIRIAARAFDSLISAYDASLYVLFNADLVLVCRDVRIGAIDPVVHKLRALFSNDPLVVGDPSDPTLLFASWYDFSDLNDYTRFVGMAKKMAQMAAQRRRGGDSESVRPEVMRGATLSPANLGVIAGKLRNLPINDLIRRQTVVNVTAEEETRPILFREHFVSMSELRKKLGLEVNLFGSPWLFQYLTEYVDKRVLLNLGSGDFAQIKDPISINLNMSSISSPEFRRFHENAGPYALRIVIEMQLIDVFSDVTTFRRVRDWLQSEGYRVLLDGLTPLSVQFFDPSLMGTDFVKINWLSELSGEVGDDRMDYLRETVEKTGKDKIILGRVEDEATVEWGLRIGIRYFQGYFVDRLVQAMAQKQIL